MDANELIDRVRAKTATASDYKLAQLLDIPRERLSDYRNGKRTPDVYACIRFAIALGVDPIEIIADVEASTEKNEARRSFWLDFRQHIGKAAVIAALVSYTSFLSQDADATTRNNWTEHPIMRSLRRLVSRRKTGHRTEPDRRRLVIV